MEPDLQAGCPAGGWPAAERLSNNPSKAGFHLHRKRAPLFSAATP